MKLTRKHIKVLQELAKCSDRYVQMAALPDGNGISGRVLGSTLREMHIEGFIERIKMDDNYYAYKITEAGQSALERRKKTPAQ